MQLYRFSPMGSKNDLLKAIQYVGDKTTELVRSILGRDLPLVYLTVFSHHPHEYEKLKEWASELGTSSEANNGTSYVLQNPLKIGNSEIRNIRVRQPDPYRMQVGCADFEVENYTSFKATEFLKHPENLRLIVRSEYEMIEFFDFDTDVFAYVISK